MKKTKNKIEPFNGVVYNSTFLEYNIYGEIVTVSNEKILGENVLEIDNSLITDFQLGNKHFRNYKIDYFVNLKKGVVQKEEILVNYTNFLYHIPLVDHYKNEITLVHNQDKWNLKIRENLKFEESNLTFFLCKKDEPSFFYSSIVFNLNKTTEIKFQNSFEYDLKSFSVLTMKKFNSYGIKDIL